MKPAIWRKPQRFVQELLFTTMVMILTIVTGCSSESSVGMGGSGGHGMNDDARWARGVSPGSIPPWEEGEDCRNWGCNDTNAAQSALAPPSNAQACSNNAECASGFCVDGVCCDNACTGLCKACTAAKKGQGADGTCGLIALYGDPDNECLDGTCDGSGGCKKYNGVTCSQGATCLSNNCIDGYCCGGACSETCRACSAAKKGGGYDGQCGTIPAGNDPDNECVNAECNGSGACSLATNLFNGQACAQASQCLSGNCVDGFCCGAACNEPCRACSAAKKGSGNNGQCGLISAGTDPDNECSNAECNGSGACNLPLNLFNGQACSQASQCLSGNCVDGVCCGAACTETCRACSAAKKGGGNDGLCGPITTGTDPDNECANAECNGSGACNLATNLFNGQACTQASQCLSGNCVDGVCCGAACTEPCRACSAAKKGSGPDGLCGTITAGTDPDNECANGECNGSGACNAPQQQANGSACSASAQCLSGFCADGVCCDSACTGTCLACSAVKKNQGANGTCGFIAYGKNPDGECVNGVCTGTGTCQGYNGASCNDATQCLSAYCVDGYCCGNACTETCRACSAAKKGGGINGQCGTITSGTDPDNECVANECNGSGACLPPVLLPNGSACGTGPECTSGFCAQGICCNSACTESCKACNLAGLVGTCSETSPGACVAPCSGTLGLPSVPNVLSKWSYSVVTADLNGDAIRDLAVADEYGNKVQVLFGLGDGTFGPAVGYPAGGVAHKLVVADLNGDGARDLVVANYDANTVSVLLNQGNGTFAAPASFATGGRTYSVAVADFNGDGTLDLAATNGSNYTVSILFGNGSGTFGPKVEYAANYQPREVDAGDLNGDGKADLVVNNNDAGAFSVLLNQGNGSFGPPAYLAAGTTPYRAIVTELNNDGKADIAVANYGGTVSVLLGNGNGTFAAEVNYPSGFGSRDVGIADISGDGKLDLVTANWFTNTSVSVLLGVGDGTFGPKVEYPTTVGPLSLGLGDLNGDATIDVVALTEHGIVNILLNGGNGTLRGPATYSASSTYGLTSADFNGDGKPDYAVTNITSNQVGILFNQGSGTFASGGNYPTLAQSYSVTTGDFNGDGKPDLVTSSYAQGLVSVLMNQGNGTFAPKVDYITGGLSREVAVADFNGDGKADLAVTNYTADTVSVLMNQGNGTFASKIDYVTGDGPAVLVAVDLSGDGKPDLAIANSNDFTISVLLNQGNGTFGNKTGYSAGTGSIAAGDISGDGKLDLVVTNYDTVSVLIGNGSGLFVSKTDYTVYVSLQSVAIADFNGDGKSDVVVGGEENVVGVLFNDGNGTLAPAVFYRSGMYPIKMTTTDVNLDGRPDIGATSNGGNSITVLMNTCLP